jgi:nitrogen regulatory protein PII
LRKVEAIIRTSRLEDVAERLALIGASEFVISEAQCIGRQAGRTILSRGSPYRVDLIPKTILEWWGDDDEAHSVVRAIAQAARTGKIVDGKIFVGELEAAYDL